MTTPVISSIQYDNDNLALYIIWDRAVTASDLSGFTFTEDACTTITPTFASVVENAVVASLAGTITGELVVDYDGAGTVVEAAAPNDPAAAFSDEVALAYPDVPVTITAQAGKATNSTVTIYFSQPVESTDGDSVAGFTVEVNDVALDLTGATATYNDDLTELYLDTGTNFGYDDKVDVAYDDGTGDLYTWKFGGSGPVASFSFDDIDNLSTDGLPNSDYPLSLVYAPTVEICSNEVKATLEVSLNPIDQKLVDRYGPLTIITGGTYGDEPNTITILGEQVNVVDGTVIEQTFVDSENCDVNNAVVAAQDWQQEIAAKIGQKLGEYRSTDQGIVFGTDTVVQV